MSTQLNTNNGPVKGEPKKPTVEVAPEQIKYANLLLYGGWAGIFTLLVTFALYMTGIMPSYVEPSQMQYYWTMKASEYLAAANVPHGWGWLKMVGFGDFLPLVGIAWLGILTILGYFILLPAYMKKKDNIYTTIVVLEILVLTLAASGILKVGGH
ncbi:MAG: membrane protein [Peptococcaceae bacterium BICA1-7]|nr:MAG: membrane protein [Peptococcaceae bacterium BICA1-7]